MPQVLKEDIREKIIWTALKYFTEKGYRNTSVKEIAVGSGIAVGNIYRYFKSKENLYDAIVLPVYNSINKLFNTPPESINIQGIENKVLEFINIFKNNKKVFMMLMVNSEHTKFENMNQTTIRNFSIAISRWLKQLTGVSADDEEKIFIKAIATAYLNGILSILSESADEKIMIIRLYKFLVFMKNGLYRNYTNLGAET